MHFVPGTGNRSTNRVVRLRGRTRIQDHFQSFEHRGGRNRPFSNFVDPSRQSIGTEVCPRRCNFCLGAARISAAGRWPGSSPLHLLHSYSLSMHMPPFSQQWKRPRAPALLILKFNSVRQLPNLPLLKKKSGDPPSVRDRIPTGFSMCALRAVLAQILPDCARPFRKLCRASPSTNTRASAFGLRGGKWPRQAIEYQSRLFVPMVQIRDRTAKIKRYVPRECN